MEFHLSIAAPALWIIVVSAILFVGVTWFTAKEGVWRDSGDYGIGALFGLLAYLMFWAVPSLLLWAVWATWFK